MCFYSVHRAYDYLLPLFLFLILFVKRKRKGISKGVMTKAYTIVIKLGSSSLVDESTKEPKLSIMTLIVETVTNLKRMGHKVIIVSSGGIAVGLDALHIPHKPKQLSEVQAIAAVGQGRLIARWNMLFSQYGEQTAQILLTRNDILRWNQYNNARNTINELLAMGVIPIVNENDTLSISEIEFGDNDTLSAITAALVGADFLFLLTDVDCLYTDNPRTNPDARPIVLVPELSEGLPGVNTSSGSGSEVGTGGMRTKLIAADLASNAGIETIVMKSDRPEYVPKIVDYIQHHFRPPRHIGNGTQQQFLDLQDTELEQLRRYDVPMHTKFLANDNKHKLKNREFWILHGLITKGAIIIDENSYDKLLSKDMASLTPNAVIEVRDNFHELECVDLKIGQRLPNGELDISKPIQSVGRVRSNYTSLELAKIKGLPSEKIHDVLGYSVSEYVAHRENIAFPPQF
ncbi:APG_G0024030.mRNA.1.CDS.1 [Saccharomyces cerevisiae]|nr:CNB_1a_G0023590.mRNA.1.CDS.1 [Saccharomyces cerevisiae]CAI4514424.1 BDH_1b_G0023750.mRNA.1.CDS.1 [Saccharomyces cerevisiae]CAI4523655.1 ACA_G0023720.mRNA.1.CDS.1 [Saccharomyces cerevisiae]CAI4530735.1 APG_G0024030.mRNA.1.CDS.1 [Saccharomyces cerevisiae]CAI4531434.1 AEH_G0023930.mRNA.1.CDS.1 [Saccharomyces cerevisiae]